MPGIKLSSSSLKEPNCSLNEPKLPVGKLSSLSSKVSLNDLVTVSSSSVAAFHKAKFVMYSSEPITLSSNFSRKSLILSFKALILPAVDFVASSYTSVSSAAFDN